MMTAQYLLDESVIERANNLKLDPNAVYHAIKHTAPCLSKCDATFYGIKLYLAALELTKEQEDRR